MKRIFAYAALASILLSGCMTNKAILLDAPAHYEGTPVINPSLSLTKGGFHPYAGISAGMTHDSSPLSKNNIEFESKNVGAHAGLLYSPNMKERHSGGGFFAVGVRGFYPLCKTEPRFDPDVVIDDATKGKLTTSATDASAEAILRGGGVIRMSRVTLAGYMGFFGDYERGEYRNFRSDVDGVGNCYNRSADAWTFGDSIGVDIAVGAADKFAFGVVVEGRNCLMRSQSYDREVRAESDDDGLFYSNYRVITKDGGSPQWAGVFKVEPYLDIKSMRVSCAVSPGNATLSTTYRW